MTTIYLVRHGHSLGNKFNLFIGQGNLDLTEIGYEQAKTTANYLNNFKIDAIYSSDLDRAYHTGLELAKLKNLTVNTDKRLREILAGEWEGKSFDDIKVQYAKDYEPWSNNIGNSFCTGGESYKDVQSRMIKAITEIALNNDGKSVAIFSPRFSIYIHATCVHTYKFKWLTLYKLTYVTYVNLSTNFFFC